MALDYHRLPTESPHHQRFPPRSQPSAGSNSNNVYLHPPSPKTRLRFILIRFFLPLITLALFISIIVLSGLAPPQLTIRQCQDGGCLKWDKVQDLAYNLGLSLKDQSCQTQTRPKLKILHLIDRHTSDVLMDRWMIHSHDAFLESQDLVSSAILWGPDFNGYSNSKTLTQNIIDKFGQANYFDAVLVYFNNDQVKFLHVNPIPWFGQIKELSQQGPGVIIIDRPHEMRDLRKEEFYKMANVSLVLAPYAYELFEYREKFGSQALLVHQPHFIRKDIFYHPVSDPRPQQTIIAGDLGAFYPFRARLAEMIRNSTLPGWIRGHPGYEDIKPPSDRNSKITGQKQEQQLVEFGRDLGHAKICLVTDSRWGYSVQKYVEAAAAGCLIVGNVPLDRMSSFSKFIVPLSNKDSDQKIIETLKFWLDHDEQRIQKAKDAQDWILNNFSTQNYVKDVVNYIHNVQDGRRGLILPYDFDFLPKELPFDG